MNEDLIHYIDQLRLNAIIYNDNIKNELNKKYVKEYVLSNEFLDLLIDRIKTNEIIKVIEDKVKENIRVVLFFIRSNRIDVADITNEILVILNNTNSINKEEFYLDEVLKRIGEDKTEQNEKELRNVNFQKSLRDSISKDYYNMVKLITSNKENIITSFKELDANFVLTLSIVRVEKPEFFNLPGLKEKVLILLNELSKRDLSNGAIYKLNKLLNKIEEQV